MLPVFDWQFVVVTMIALGAGAIVLRRLLPARKVKAKGADAPAVPAPSVACSHCASADAAAKPKPTPLRTATVPVVSVGDLRQSAHQRRS
jgi:hypothetical protein